MKKVVIVGALALMLILGCSTPSVNPVGDSSKIWWNAPDSDARWIDISNICSNRVPSTQTAADSVCQGMGYSRSSGYVQENCYISGEKQVVLSRVACSIN